MPSSTSVRWAYPAALMFLLLVWPAFYSDIPIARWMQGELLPGDLERLVKWSEVFAHAVGVAVIALTVFVLDPRQRFRIPRLLASAYLAGLLANVFKLIVARIRPGEFDLNGNWRDTFVGWLPTLRGTPAGFDYGHALQSMPSAHTATTVGLAIGLTRIYPRGRWLFTVFAVLATFQRIHGAAHYLSDTLVGAAIGLVGAAAIADPRLLGPWFDRLEGRLQNRVADTTTQSID